MTQVSGPFDTLVAETGGVVVRRPRACDAVGKALRQAFAADERGTRDWRRALCALEQLG